MYPNFAVNFYLVSGKWSDWSKNWYTHVPWDIRKLLTRQILDIFLF